MKPLDPETLAAVLEKVDRAIRRVDRQRMAANKAWRAAGSPWDYGDRNFRDSLIYTAEWSALDRLRRSLARMARSGRKP